MAEAAGLAHVASRDLWDREGPGHKRPEDDGAAVVGALWLQI